jgi:hypothetical protein
MKRFTVSIPDELKKEMDVFPDINWAHVAKECIEKKVLMLEEFERFKRSCGN